MKKHKSYVNFSFLLAVQPIRNFLFFEKLVSFIRDEKRQFCYTLRTTVTNFNFERQKFGIS
jgi:hypothetical protein